LLLEDQSSPPSQADTLVAVNFVPRASSGTKQDISTP
jgi:hypothetical protein